MKKGLKLVSLLLTLSLLLAVPVNAESSVESRGSIFFSSYGAAIYKETSNSFEIWYDVTANAAIMEDIGVSMIEVYQSADGENWAKIKIYEMDAYSSMIRHNTAFHTGHLTYNFAIPGYYYRAYVTFYAKNSAGIGKRFVYTNILHM